MNHNRIGFIFHKEKPESIPAMITALDTAQKHGFECAVDPQCIDYFPDHRLFSIESSQLDFLVVLGGDGTILRASALAASLQIPLLGVNLGRIGFLSETSVSEFDAALQSIQNGEYRLEYKMMLSCSINNGTEYYCLNDFLLYKHSFSGVAHINISVNGLDAGSVFCDGLIVSTPTGSTGYSISAGGPVISPGLDVSIVTPICPHSLYMRPIVSPADADLCFVMQSEGYLSADGQQIAEIGPSDTVRITKASIGTEFIRLGEGNLYQLIKDKLT